MLYRQGLILYGPEFVGERFLRSSGVAKVNGCHLGMRFFRDLLEPLDPVKSRKNQLFGDTLLNVWITKNTWQLDCYDRGEEVRGA